MSPVDRLAHGAACLAAGSAETRISFLGSNKEAFRAGWAWTEGARALEDLRLRLETEAFVMAWEGGACAFLPQSPDSPVLAAAPGMVGRAHCPGVGLFGALLARGGPALAEIPDGGAVLLSPPDADSAHARLRWASHLPDPVPARHPLAAAGVLLRRAGPLVGAFAPGDPWPLAMRRLDR